ncbi:MAG: dTDP-4-dehydrorhamnose reductase [Rhodobacter sp.]|nr:dTDP-4-dehydrorhamnose reductase [Rhodobacter sp.]
MKALIFGAGGQVGSALRRRAPAGVTVAALSRAEAALTDPQACAARIAGAAADLAINAAAFTAVDRAETQEPLATVINAAAPGAMAQAAAARGLPFLQLSTDYVFDGSGDRPWRPEDAPAPLNAYGRSKLAGEAAVRAAGGPHLILRTSWVFSAEGANFPRTMLRLAETRDALDIVDDQVGGPTPADAIADALWTMAAALIRDARTGGTYHLSGAPDVSWADFARAIFAQAGRAVTVTGIPSAAFPTAAPRPANSRLDCTRTARVFGIDRPDWRAGLARALGDGAEGAT